MTIIIHPANPDWPLHFQRVKARLMPALPEGAALHHIGSTAVPGLAAKDIIDIQLSVRRLDEIDPTALQVAGFMRRAPVSDHCPPGMTLAPEDLAKRLFGATDPKANVHVREVGRFNQRYPLLCRDYLRARPLAAAAYGAIKQNLAVRFAQDADSYDAIKDPVFDLIMAGAEDWALVTGWQLPEGD